MKINKSYDIFFATVLLALISGCSKDKTIHDYSEELQINFPENMTLVDYEIFSDFQDYSIHSIYKLSFNQKNTFLEEIVNHLCDSIKETDEHYSCWLKCDDYYSYEFNNQEKGIKINIVFIAKNNISTLNIYEVKF